MKESLHVLMTDRYRNQVFNSSQRNHPLPSYTLDEFLTWVDSQHNAKELFDNWKFSNYLKSLAPSVDRINSLLPYTLDNIVLTTWEVNNKNNHKDQANGINISHSVPVVSYTPCGTLIKKYTSMLDASR